MCIDVLDSDKDKTLCANQKIIHGPINLWFKRYIEIVVFQVNFVYWTFLEIPVLPTCCTLYLGSKTPHFGVLTCVYAKESLTLFTICFSIWWTIAYMCLSKCSQLQGEDFSIKASLCFQHFDRWASVFKNGPSCSKAGRSESEQLKLDRDSF